MSRFLPFLIGLALLLGGGVVHGLWTDRWREPEDLAEAAARLEVLPDDPLAGEPGGWRAEKYEQDPDELKLTGAVAHWSRTFTDPETGEKVLVIILCGKARPMAVHRPEHCYSSAGYEMTEPALKVELRHNDRSTVLWSRNFARDEGGKTGQPDHLRIFWAWHVPGSALWQAPDSPRLTFAGQRVLYKMYVIRNLASSVSVANDKCLELLDRLLPILDKALSPS
jgi:Protein of unknown function (DUF3485)